MQENRSFRRKPQQLQHSKNVNEIIGKTWNQNSTILNSNDEILIEVEKKLKRWKEYVEEGFDGNRSINIGHNEETHNAGWSITKSEVLYDIRTQKSGKTMDPGQIFVEIKDCGGPGCQMIKLVHKPFQCHVCHRKIPSDEVISFITPM